MRRWSRRAFLSFLGATAGCLGNDPESTSTAPSESTTAERVDVREWPDEYYQGPLVSAHEHMHGWDGYSVIREDIEWYVRWMARNKVEQVIGFAADEYMGQLVEHDERLLPFVFGWDELREDYDSLAAAFRQRLEAWPYVGLGELGFKGRVTPEGEPPPQPDDPEALELWDLAAERGIPVMVHASEPWRYPEEMRKEWDEFSDCPTKASLANAMAHNRDTQFLVHATYQWQETPTGELVADALENNPNLTYDISTLHPLAYREGTFTEDEFRTRIAERGGVETIAQRFYDEYEVVLEEYSDRLTWGMDASAEWHYTDWALDTWVDAGRALLGMLPEENARNIGYRTVSDLMDIEVTSSA
ncbi:MULTISPECIES: hypothetical protein [Salinibaculum]|uniref:hypothetical protein n=1 Tax=Salinibaculum TaxID=2732368 RepID=UPI0030D55489